MFTLNLLEFLKKANRDEERKDGFERIKDHNK